MSKPFTFIDLFAGIGGFHLGLSSAGGKCVFASEWDKFARKTYETNFAKKEPELFMKSSDGQSLFAGDITKVDEKKIPSHDVLCGGFPCQAFSGAGKQLGFSDPRGTMFFEIVRIMKHHRPKAFFLENVRNLMQHNEGETFSTIKRILTEELGYSFEAKLIRASDFGLPQHRPRVYMVGFRDPSISFRFPEKRSLDLTMSDVFEGKCDREIGFTLRCGGKGSGVNDRRNWDCYMVDGKERRLSPKEGKKMQGFPETFEFPVSNTQAMKQLGNSVAVSAIAAVATEIADVLNKNPKL